MRLTNFESQEIMTMDIFCYQFLLMDFCFRYGAGRAQSAKALGNWLDSPGVRLPAGERNRSLPLNV